MRFIDERAGYAVHNCAMVPSAAPPLPIDRVVETFAVVVIGVLLRRAFLYFGTCLMDRPDVHPIKILVQIIEKKKERPVRRYYIKVGDKTTSGAQVVEGMESMIHHGTMLSFLGAKVYCPACESEGCIVGTGPRWPDDLMGKHAALDNDLGMCKCQPTPRLIASQDDMFESFEPHELVSMGFAPTGVPLPKPPIGTFDERVRIVDPDGQPISGMPYHIRDRSGRTYRGLTDTSGYCPRVFTENRQDLLVSVGMKALEQWKQ